MDARARRNYLYKERIIHIEFKISRLGILGKEYYELAQIKLKRHRIQISIARTQNLLLHGALDTLREKDKIARKNAGDLENLRKRAATLRTQFDHERQRVQKRHRQLEWQITGTHSTELECAGVLDPNTTPDMVIRALEVKLARVQVRMHGVQILVKQYEATLHPLRDEWILYDAKLAALQDHLNLKNRECESLINTHHDAIRARDAAKIELEEGLMSPDLRIWILRAIREIKVVMDVGSMREMYNQYLVQEKQSSYLESIYEEMSRALRFIRDDDYRRTRKKSSIKERNREDIERMLGGTVLMVRRQSEWKGAYPLLQILDKTRVLVDRLHGQDVFSSSHRPAAALEKCRLSMIRMIEALYRQLKAKHKEAVKKAEYEAKEAAHWQREANEVARKNKAAEDARRKYEARAATREAILERERKEALRQIEQYEEEPHQVQQEYQVPGADPSSLTVSPTPQSTEGVTSSANDYMVSQYHQLAKETQGVLVTPTLIFLPARGGGAAFERELAAHHDAAVLSSDESPVASTTDDAKQRTVTPSPDAETLALTETGPTAVSDQIGSAAEALGVETISTRDPGEEAIESASEPYVDAPVDATPADAISGVLSGEEGIYSPETPSSAVCTTPTESEVEPDQLLMDGSVVRETTLEQEGPGAEIAPPRPEEGTSSVTPLSGESTPVEKHGEEKSDVIGLGTSDQILTAEPTSGEISSTPLALSSDERSEEEGMPQEMPVQATSSDIVASGLVPSAPVSDLLSGETLPTSSDGKPAMISTSSDTAETIAEDESRMPSATTAASQGDEPVAQSSTAEKEPAASVQSVDEASGASPGDDHDLVPPAVVGTESVGDLSLSQGTKSVSEISLSSGRGVSAAPSPRPPEIRLPRSASGAPIASGLKPGSLEVLSIDESFPQRPRSPSLPRSPSGAPVATAVTFPFEPLTLDTQDESISHSSTPNLPRSPSGAPIATAALLSFESVSWSRDESSISQRLLIPNLPRSPSGAPIATSARFPLEPLPFALDDNIRQRSTVGSRSRTSSVTSLSKTSSPREPFDAGGTSSDTAKLPPSSLGETVSTEAKLPEKAGSSDLQE